MDPEFSEVPNQTYSPDVINSMKGPQILVSPQRANQTHYRASPGTQLSHIPIKTRLKSMEESLKDLKKELNENKKEGQILRSDCYQMEHKNKEFCNQILKQQLGQITELEKDFKKAGTADQNEMTFLKQQLIQITQQKTKLQSNVVVLSTRVNNMEQELGFQDQIQ